MIFYKTDEEIERIRESCLLVCKALTEVGKMIRPGISGLAQVQYRFDYSQKITKERVKFDIYYVENMSLSMDLRIIVRSFLLFFT